MAPHYDSLEYTTKEFGSRDSRECVVAGVRNAMGRLRDPSNLATTSYECEREEYDALVAICNQCGLSVQNAMHIALRRLVAY